MRGAEGGGGELTLEQYEKELPSHGDRLAHRFISRLQQAPGQILRYGRDAEPLLLHSLPKGRSPTCQHCGGELSFELQLLPAVLAKLNLVTKDERCRDIGHTGLLEFGTVIFYTCREACWTPDEAGYREEKVIVQAETI
jgi:pre-rRNA-processing protein TSR4